MRVFLDPRDPKRPFISASQECVECGRVFNLENKKDANEWYYGHDCE